MSDRRAMTRLRAWWPDHVVAALVITTCVLLLAQPAALGRSTLARTVTPDVATILLATAIAAAVIIVVAIDTRRDVIAAAGLLILAGLMGAGAYSTTNILGAQALLPGCGFAVAAIYLVDRARVHLLVHIRAHDRRQ